MAEDWIRDYYGFGDIWSHFLNSSITPPHVVKTKTMGATLRQLIEQLEAMATDIEEKEDDFEADITLRYNGNIYDIQIKKVVSEENTTEITDEDSSNGA